MEHEFDNPTGQYIDNLLGRYEYKNGRSNKFYEVMYCGRSSTGQPLFQIYWGRIGSARPQGSRQVDLSTAREKIEEKKHKGYVYVPGSYKCLAQQRHVEMMKVVKSVRPNHTPSGPSPDPSRPKM